MDIFLSFWGILQLVVVRMMECDGAWMHQVRNIHTVNRNAFGEKDFHAVDLLKESHTFPLSSLEPTEEFEIQAFGSISTNCSAEVYCDRVNLPERNQGGSCVNGYLVVGDSFGSEAVACGRMDFGLPIRPSRGGRDLYIKIKGNSSGTTCTVQCGKAHSFVELPANRHSGVFETRRCVCGRKRTASPGDSDEDSEHIVGGRTTREFEYPWMASLVYQGTNMNKCGASLINDKYILTAAHCAERLVSSPSGLQVLLHAHLLDLRQSSSFVGEDVPAGEPGSIKEVKGYYEPNKTDKDENRVRLNIDSVMIHPLFSWAPSLRYDVAILRLSRRLNMVNNENGSVGTICLPKAGSSRLHQDEMLKVIGWGRPHENAGASNRLLQEVDVSIYSEAKCKDSIRAYRWASVMFCAGFMEGKKDACQGDSGGPGVVKVGNNHFQLMGTVSWGSGCAKPGSPGVYSFLAEMNEWIRHSTQDAVWCSYPD